MGKREQTFEAIEHVQRLAALFRKRRSQLARRADLTEAEWRVLEGVASEHFMPSMFADDLDNSRGAVSKILKQLVGKELIKGTISSTDRRQREYKLTAKGHRAIEVLRSSREEAIQEIWSELSSDQLSAFNQTCVHLTERLREYASTQDLD